MPLVQQNPVMPPPKGGAVSGPKWKSNDPAPAAGFSHSLVINVLSSSRRDHVSESELPLPRERFSPRVDSGPFLSTPRYSRSSGIPVVVPARHRSAARWAPPSLPNALGDSQLSRPASQGARPQRVCRRFQYRCVRGVHGRHADSGQWVHGTESQTYSNYREYLGDRYLMRDPAPDSRSQLLPLWRSPCNRSEWRRGGNGA